MVRSPTDSGWSAATQVKAVSPEILLLARGQGLVCPSSQHRGRRYQASLSRHAGVAGRSGTSNGLHRNLGEPHCLHAPTSRRSKAGP